MEYNKRLAFPKPESKRKKHNKPPKAQGACIICGRPSCKTPHHIITRGAFGSDDRINLIDLCPLHHNEAHASGRESFFKKYGIVHLLEAALKLRQSELAAAKERR